MGWSGDCTDHLFVPVVGAPLLGVALQEADIEQAVHCAQHMLTPPQQRLPDNLTELMERAVAARERGESDAANDLLHLALQKAHTMGYV